MVGTSFPSAVGSTGRPRNGPVATGPSPTDWEDQMASANGLSIDRHKEEKAVELFAENIMRAGEVFLSNPMETPFMPSWNRVISAIPDILDLIYEAVEADNK